MASYISMVMDLRKNTAVNLTVYLIALAGTMIGEVNGTRSLVLACKPLLMIVLSSWFFFNSRRVGDRFTLLVQAALFFSLIGDVALLFQRGDPFYFLIGLGAFLVAQLCYTMGFAQNIADGVAGRAPLVPMLIAGMLVAVGTLLVLTLLPRLDETLVLPVVIYACAITLMGIMAAFRYGRTGSLSFALVLGGALLFITSDSILALDRFNGTLAHARWSIMLTYGLAQLLIASGALVHVLAPEEIRRKAALST